MAFFTSKNRDDTPEKLSDDAVLVGKAIDGDAAAFGELVEKYQSFVYRTVFYDLKSHEDAQDISQEIFIKAYKALSSFRADSEFTTWLYRICKNTVYDYLRKNAKKKPLLFSELSSPEDGDREFDIADTSGNYDPEKTAVSNETARIVNDAIRTLSEEHRTIIVMRDIEGMSYSQIADVMSLEEGTVKSRLSRARAALKKKLEGTGLL
ncbi:MAG: sigma-70 family RNA polymerase sigma factor [Ruminococcaceae bacterium]|nr:sigma-70 family RNA polymerase sigma factor [Oscillospiraceae bacterium]